MAAERFNTALIVGAGSGLSASLARALAAEGIKVALAARKIEAKRAEPDAARAHGAPGFGAPLSPRSCSTSQKKLWRS